MLYHGVQELIFFASGEEDNIIEPSEEEINP